VRIVAWGGGALVVAGVIVLAVAGVAGATAVLITAVALVGMIALGGVMGGRHTPHVAPRRPATDVPASPTDAPRAGVVPEASDAEGAGGGPADGGSPPP
jgi:hypothetical protein